MCLLKTPRLPLPRALAKSSRSEPLSTFARPRNSSGVSRNGSMRGFSISALTLCQATDGSFFKPLYGANAYLSLANCGWRHLKERPNGPWPGCANSIRVHGLPRARIRSSKVAARRFPLLKSSKVGEIISRLLIARGQRKPLVLSQRRRYWQGVSQTSPSVRCGPGFPSPDQFDAPQRPTDMFDRRDSDPRTDVFRKDIVGGASCIEQTSS